MNPLVKHYAIDTQFPEASGIEHLEMLHIRSRLAEMEAVLSIKDRRLIAEADKRLVGQAALFWHELQLFVDLASERHKRQTSPEQWWWYLDVLAQLPQKSLLEMPVIA